MVTGSGARQRSAPIRRALLRTAASAACRVALALAVAIGLLLATPQVARGSCSAPVLADQIRRAELIATGVVTAVALGGNPITFRPSVIYRGTLSAGPVIVRIGPRLEGASNPFGLVHSTVDYKADASTMHTLYLHRTGSELGTDSCSGSHPGLASGAEISALGPGQTLDSDAGPLAQLFDQPATIPLLLYLVVSIILVLVIVVLRSRRRPPMTPLSGAAA